MARVVLGGKKPTMNQAMRYRVLGSTGMRLSIISLGGSGYGKVYGDYDETVMQRGLRYWRYLVCVLVSYATVRLCFAGTP